MRTKEQADARHANLLEQVAIKLTVAMDDGAEHWERRRKKDFNGKDTQGFFYLKSQLSFTLCQSNLWSFVGDKPLTNKFPEDVTEKARKLVSDIYALEEVCTQEGNSNRIEEALKEI